MIQSRYWDKYFSDYKKHNLNQYNSNTKALVQNLKKICQKQQKSKKILDVGGGTGDLIKFLFPNVTDISLVDISPLALKKAKEKGIKTKLVDIEIKKLPFKSNTFDFILSSEVIEHLKNTDHFLSEIYRVLKPNGKFLISTPNVCSLSSRIRVLFGFTPTTCSFDSSHIQIFNFDKLSNQIKSHQFKVFLKTTNQMFIPTLHTLLPIPILKITSLGEQIIIFSKK